MVIKKMSEIMDTANKGESTCDVADATIDSASDQEKIVEVGIQKQCSTRRD